MQPVSLQPCFGTPRTAMPFTVLHDILRFIMKIVIIHYANDRFGVLLTEDQIELLRRIAVDRKISYALVVEYFIQAGFENLENYKFTEPY